MSDINYEKLLDDWAENLLLESDKLELKADCEQNFNSYRTGWLKGIAEGYRAAIVKLSLMEKKLNNNIKWKFDLK